MLSERGKAVPLSFDHKPGNELESQRIRDAGGWVEFNRSVFLAWLERSSPFLIRLCVFRVNGNLALSRALGDFSFKKNEDKSPEEQIVTGTSVAKKT